MNSYTVESYDISQPNEGRVTKTITAVSAGDALMKRRKEMGFSGGFNFTRKAQNHENEAVRDNGHYQFDSNGFRGISAAREGFEQAVIDA